MGAPLNEISAHPKSSTKNIMTLGLLSSALVIVQKVISPIKNNLKIILICINVICPIPIFYQSPCRCGDNLTF